MKNKFLAGSLTLLAISSLSLPTLAEDTSEKPEENILVSGYKPEFLLANSRGPIGQMGDHMHEDGDWMFSYRYMHMAMAGNRYGTSDLDSDTIATTVPNIFFGEPMMPPTLRVVPTEMNMKMHMMGVMYGPNRNLTLVLMGMFHEKEMTHTTYMGGMGTTVLGHFTTSAEGFADTKVSALIRLKETDKHDLHGQIGFSLPTGSTTETGVVLTPMDTTPTLRLPYAMQLGSGTYDFEPGLTYNGHTGDWGWSLYYRGIVRIDRNNEGYAFGDKHTIGGNVSYLFAPSLSGSLGIEGQSEGTIDGYDTKIMAPVQTADPANYGGERINLSLGINLSGTSAKLEGHRLGIEVKVPVFEDLNGLQMKSDFTVIAGYQHDF